MPAINLIDIIFEIAPFIGLMQMPTKMALVFARINWN
jgi:biopolymer transport protein ExbB/TolQ